MHGRVDIAVVRRPTPGTHPLLYLQACVVSGTGEAPACRTGLGGETGGNFEASSTRQREQVMKPLVILGTVRNITRPIPRPALPTGERRGPGDGLLHLHQTGHQGGVLGRQRRQLLCLLRHLLLLRCQLLLLVLELIEEQRNDLLIPYRLYRALGVARH